MDSSWVEIVPINRYQATFFECTSYNYLLNMLGVHPTKTFISQPSQNSGLQVPRKWHKTCNCFQKELDCTTLKWKEQNIKKRIKKKISYIRYVRHSKRAENENRQEKGIWMKRLWFSFKSYWETFINLPIDNQLRKIKEELKI